MDDHLKFDATPYDSEGNSLMGRPVRWASENSLVAAVDQSSGETTGMSAGTVKITAESEAKLDSAQVTVSPKSTQTPSGEAPLPAPTAAAAPPPPAPNRAAERAKPDTKIGRVAEKIFITNTLKFGECPANIRVIVGGMLIDLKSDPQEAARVPFGDQPYNLHGTVSCPHQTVAVVNGHGTISIANGKTYRCKWLRKGSKDFEIDLHPE